MTSAAEKLRQNALRVKESNEVRRSQPARANATSEVAESGAGEGAAAADEAAAMNVSPQPSESRDPLDSGSQGESTRPQQARRPRAGKGTPAFAPRKAPVRRTVDLTPAAHSKLDDWQRRTAREIGVARVSGQEVLSTLVDEFLDNPELAAAIRDSIWRRRQ